MKVLQFGKYFPPDRGGIETVTYGLAESLNALGVACDVFCFNHHDEHVEEERGAYRVTRCATAGHLFSTPLSWRSLAAFRRIMDEYDVVVVHLPNPTANLVLRLSGYTGHIVALWHCDVVRYPRLMRAYRPLQDWLIRRAGLVVGATESHIAESDSAALLAPKAMVIPFGLDPEIFHGEESDSETERLVESLRDRRVVLSVGRFVYYKGMAHLIEAARLLPDDYVVVLVGGGPLEDEHESRIDALGLAGRVLLMGEARPARLAALYRACDVFCLPSVTRAEMFGMVQIEAMYFGKPVVSTRVPRSGMHHVNRHGETGLVVEPGNPVALAKAIEEICSDPERRAEMSKHCTTAFETRFRSDIVARQHRDAYEQLVASGEPRA